MRWDDIMIGFIFWKLISVEMIKQSRIGETFNFNASSWFSESRAFKTLDLLGIVPGDFLLSIKIHSPSSHHFWNIFHFFPTILKRISGNNNKPLILAKLGASDWIEGGQKAKGIPGKWRNRLRNYHFSRGKLFVFGGVSLLHQTSTSFFTPKFQWRKSGAKSIGIKSGKCWMSRRRCETSWSGSGASHRRSTSHFSVQFQTCKYEATIEWTEYLKKFNIWISINTAKFLHKE